MSHERTLILARHAKSSWGDSSLRDFDRPLDERGLRDLPRMAERLRARGLHVERALSSPAERAKATAQQLAPALGVAADAIELVSEVYDASWQELLEVLRRYGGNAAALLVVGHNPGMTHLVNQLARAQIDSLPTCAVVELRLRLEPWAVLGVGGAELVEFDYPKRDLDL